MVRRESCERGSLSRPSALKKHEEHDVPGFGRPVCYSTGGSTSKTVVTGTAVTAWQVVLQRNVHGTGWAEDPFNRRRPSIPGVRPFPAERSKRRLYIYGRLITLTNREWRTGLVENSGSATMGESFFFFFYNCDLLIA